MDLETDQGKRWHPAARIAVSLATGIALGYAAAFMLFLGLVVFTGCFIECSRPTPNPVVGSLLVVGSVAAGAGVVTSLAAAIGGIRARLKKVFFGSAGVIAVLLVVVFFNT